MKQAIALYNQSLQINDRISHVQGKVMSLWCLGHFGHHEYYNTTAIEYLQETLEILERLKSPHTETVRKMLALS